MKTRQQFTNDEIARRAISMLLNYGHNFEVGYDRSDMLAPSIEITFRYKFQGVIRRITTEPANESDLMEIKSLIKD